MTTKKLGDVYLALQGAAHDLRRGKKRRHWQVAMVLDEMARYLDGADQDDRELDGFSGLIVDAVEFHVN